MRRLAVVAVAGALTVAGCGGDDESQDESANQPSSPGERAPAGGGGTVVDMDDRLTFAPKRIEVSAGEKVTWKNVGKIAHTVTADKSKAADASLVSIPAGTEEWDSGFVGEGESFARRFEAAGTYRYICIPHEGTRMVGSVIVK